MFLPDSDNVASHMQGVREDGWGWVRQGGGRRFEIQFLSLPSPVKEVQCVSGPCGLTHRDAFLIKENQISPETSSIFVCSIRAASTDRKRRAGYALSMRRVVQGK